MPIYEELIRFEVLVCLLKEFLVRRTRLDGPNASSWSRRHLKSKSMKPMHNYDNSAALFFVYDIFLRLFRTSTWCLWITVNNRKDWQFESIYSYCWPWSFRTQNKDVCDYQNSRIWCASRRSSYRLWNSVCVLINRCWSTLKFWLIALLVYNWKVRMGNVQEFRGKTL